MSARLVGHLRTAITLAALALLFVYAVVRGLEAVSEPFPELAESRLCVDTALAPGDVLTPESVTVSVVNAGGTNGLASDTRDDLIAQGFVRGDISTARDPDVRSAVIRAPEGSLPAVRLLRSHLGGRVTVEQADVVGLVLVVGDDFAGVRRGQPRVRVATASTVCGPAALSPEAATS